MITVSLLAGLSKQVRQLEGLGFYPSISGGGGTKDLLSVPK